MRVLVIGSGGREHALCWKIASSPLCSALYCAPGNDGIAQVAELLPIAVNQQEALLEAAKRLEIDLVVIGPDDCLANGLSDFLRDHGLTVFGPSKAAAQLEWSKAFSKSFMQRHKLPTASWQAFQDPDEANAYLKTVSFPIVIKANGLALGKGVVIANNYAEAAATVNEMMTEQRFGSAGETIVIEEFLQGREFSLLAFCDGKTARIMPPVEDHKQIFEGDLGPNTGGMGTICPLPFLTLEDAERIQADIIQPVIKAMHSEGTPFQGVLFTGFMLTDSGPKVLEFNARFGDPETQPLMLLLETDLLEVMLSCCKGTLDQQKILWKNQAAACVILASPGYPNSYPKGLPISGLDQLSSEIVVFHAGTKSENGYWRTNGGRVLGVSATSSTSNSALKKVYDAIESISFQGMQYRKDIGQRKELRR